MISECLQKDPSKRPTASELLKHAFFKNKAKDKKYLQGVLVNAAPNPEVKVNKTKSKKPGTSGRLHRNETGDWVWSSDEEDSDDETIQKKGPKNKQVSCPFLCSIQRRDADRHSTSLYHLYVILYYSSLSMKKTFRKTKERSTWC